ncbi:MAG: hypothetical protein LBU04_07910 [Christensenellaceae bacterium]|jgi:hypothetical protein|nr:hypothetical protein [Christensenellaceae bacterium]
MTKYLFSFLCSLSFILFFLTNNAYTQDNKPIPLNEITKYIIAAPVYPGDKFLDTKVISLEELINSAIKYYQKNGKNLKIYNNSTTTYNPSENDAYMVLINDDSKQGFRVIEPKGAVLKKESEVIFSFSCTIETYELQGNFCVDFEVSIDGIKQNQDKVMTENPIFLDAIKNSDRSSWNEAG